VAVVLEKERCGREREGRTDFSLSAYTENAFTGTGFNAIT
jgi:hypothetical protein